MTSLLRIDSSARYADSVSRMLIDQLIDRLGANGPLDITHRDLTKGVSLLDEATLGAAFTPVEQRTGDHTAILAEGQAMIEELQGADVVVIGLPIYNFGPPASLKAWADLVARAGQTFQYSEQGPRGLLADRPVYVVVTSGGIPLDAPMDHASTWLRSFLGFLGLTNVTMIAATGLNTDPEAALLAAKQAVIDVDFELAPTG